MQLIQYPLKFDNSIECTDVESQTFFQVKNHSKITYIDVLDLSEDSELCKVSTFNYEKRTAFEKANLPYLQFFADEVFDKSEIVKSIVLSRLGAAKERYHARKLILKEVSIEESKQFFNSNHLMGYKAARAIGLYDNNDLICVLSYKKYGDRIEIERFCTKLNASCAGGFGKLVGYLKQFKKPIVSYCDLRYSDGHSYEAVGFKNEGETLGWLWTDGNKRFNRLMCKATKDKTQSENAADKGWFKIYDAGQRKYRLDI